MSRPPYDSCVVEPEVLSCPVVKGRTIAMGRERMRAPVDKSPFPKEEGERAENEPYSSPARPACRKAGQVARMNPPHVYLLFGQSTFH